MSQQIQFLTAGGHRLEYQWIDARDKGLPALVFLHQGLGSVALWGDFPARLAERTGCGVLLYSRYGYGRSDVLTAPRPIDFLQIEGGTVLPEVLREARLEDVILIGHSDGATAALICAGMQYPVRALAVVAPHVRDEPVTYEAIVKQRAKWHGSILRERLARYHHDVDRMFNSWADVWLSAHMRGWSIEPLLAQICCPVLAIQGVEDEHGTMMQIDRIAALSEGPVMLEKWETCGHDPFRAAPDRMLDRLARFIAQTSS